MFGSFCHESLFFIIHGSKECPRKQQCFSGAACGESDQDGSSETVILDETTSQFFCGSSWGDLINSCDDATPCPSGTNAGEI